MLSLVAQADLLTREDARDAARAELSKPDYQVGEPSLLDRIAARIIAVIAEIASDIVSVVPGGITGLAAGAALLVGVIVLFRVGLGPLGVRNALVDRRRGARSRSAEDYRREADQLAASGDHRAAVRARFRAIARELEQRGVLVPQVGRTAGEIAGEAELAVAAVGPPLTAAAELFDAIWYGGRAAGPEQDAAMQAADRQVRETQLTVAQ